MKKLFALIMSLTMTILLSVSAFAAEPSTIQSSDQMTSFNEYDYIDTLQSCSTKELAELGMTKQEVSKIVSSFKNSLLERSTLSDSELKAYGYNNAEISLFHDLANGNELSDAELRSLGATCTGKLIKSYCAPDSAKFGYKFTWNRCPNICLSDSAAIRWAVYDNAGAPIGVEIASYDMVIEYHFKGNAASDGSPALAHYGSGKNQPNLDFDALNMQFPVYETHVSEGTGIIFDCYAKTGTVTVTIKVPTANKAQRINHIFVGGLYGHTLIGIGSPSITAGKGSIGIGFTGNTSINSIASCKGTIAYRVPGIEYWKE